jgi:hypothetical protein
MYYELSMMLPFADKTADVGPYNKARPILISSRKPMIVLSWLMLYMCYEFNCMMSKADRSVE